ncbi:hypothetical protein PoB_005629100 [Plakobranchus ocellatus]|uniref:Arrestin C-terminal-like domain-containing protein n=1 Tax=Plakobranchus ocellatus TaxID=259542 RepID=A0AAV4C353_9GAST|nr:hypothetical protein PoB_005629100 [Plakobranchus ocellatus]
MANFSSLTFDEEDDEHEERGPISDHYPSHRHQESIHTKEVHISRESRPTTYGGGANKDRGDDNDNYETKFDNPAYRPFDTLPYTDFMKADENDKPIFSGNHLIHPKSAVDASQTPSAGGSAGSRFNSYSKRDGYVVNFNNRRNKPQRNHYYHDNFQTHKANHVPSYIGRRLGPHHKYATTRHSPILAYNSSRLAMANGDIRKSQSLGRSSARYLQSPAPAVLIPTPVIYSHAPFFHSPYENTGFDNPMLAHQNDLPNGTVPFARNHRSNEMERRDDAEEAESRRESHSTGERSSGAGAVISFLRHPRGGHLSDKKESCVSFFDIETDKVSSYQYRPGEEVSGVVTLIVRHTLEIRFVELVVTGRGYITFRQPEGREGSMNGRLGRTTKETYLYKRTYVIGTGDEAWSSLLTPGTYSSKFRVKLPKGLPSTLRHQNSANGISMEISYTLKARICDDPGAHTSVRSRSSTRSQRNGQLVRVLMYKQINFNVQRSFDLSMIPGASVPFSHTEQLFLSCAHSDAAIVTVNLDRSVFLAGDDVKLQLSTSLPNGQRVKEITCSLQEHLILDPKREPITVKLTRMLRKDPGQVEGRSTNQVQQEKDEFEVTIPTQTDLISPFSLGASKTKIEYSLAIGLKFSRSGGKLAFKVRQFEKLQKCFYV